LTAERSLHLTLAFLGPCSRSQAGAVAVLLPAIAAPVGELRSAGAVWLPGRRSTVLTVALVATTPLQALPPSIPELMCASRSCWLVC